ncbi:MAG TPA: phosphonate metabolism protein/1,5-bisphosphokinase (PRPP-forming) PhnN [Pseudolabrys sp.]|nr:phosphonate metabolism protein/1,5-bisphosphokinase (PRPP-forming) PhnN [Pseudolabrys sp.]
MSASTHEADLAAGQRIGPGRLVLVVGPSGAGKDTLIAHARAACSSDSGIVFPRRAVTRTVSGAEDHDSLSDDAFDRAVTDGSFAFHWQAHGLKYGIWRTVEDDLRGGRTVVCNVSRTVVAGLRQRYARVDAVLITAPAEVLAARLAGRARASDGALTQRLQRNAAFETFRADHVIDNIGATEIAARHLLAVIRPIAAGA